jgi:hypothetical protein
MTLSQDTLASFEGDHLLVAYPCVYNPRQRRITAVDGTGRQSYRQVQVMQLILWALELVRTVWRMSGYRCASWQPVRVQRRKCTYLTDLSI